MILSYWPLFKKISLVNSRQVIMKMSVTLHDHYVVNLKQFSGLNSFELVVTVRLKADDNNLFTAVNCC